MARQSMFGMTATYWSAMSVDESMLRAVEIVAGYGKRKVLDGISIAVESGEIVAIIGPNGCGKTTMLKTIAGIADLWSGDILLDGMRLNNMGTAERLNNGLTFCPQGNLVFQELSVKENINLGGTKMRRTELQENRDRVLALFPTLRQRLNEPAEVLSGGEQQMVSLARALLSCPKVMMLDEPSLGLSPSLLADLFDKLDGVRKATGVAILIVEQKVERVLELADNVVAMRLGKAAFAGSAADLRGNDAALREVFL